MENKIRNRELFEYLTDVYMKDNNCSLKQVSEKFGLSVGGVKNFCYRHKISKKEIKNDRRKEIVDLYKNGVKIKYIAKIFDTSYQNVALIIKNANNKEEE